MPEGSASDPPGGGVVEAGGSLAVQKGSRFVPTLLLIVALLLLLVRGIDWNPSITLGGSPRFSSGGDFRDFDALVARLSAPQETDFVSPFLWTELADSTRVALASPSTDPPRRAREVMLATDLNRIIESGYSIYSEERFPLDTAYMRGFAVWLLDTGSLDEAPDSLAHTLLVTGLPDSLGFRVAYERAEGPDAVEYVDFHEHEHGLARDSVLLETIRERLTSSALAPYIGRALPAELAAPLLEDVTALLGLTGLNVYIDEEIRNRRARGSTDYAWLNRLLLEHTYPEAIEPKYGSDERGLVALVTVAFSSWAADDIPKLVRFQLRTAWVLTLFALIPGVAGLIFRRAFAKWFLATFAILFLVNWLSYEMGWGTIGAELVSSLNNPYWVYLWIETVLVLVVLVFRLERHSAALIDERTRRITLAFGLVMSLVAGGLVWGMLTGPIAAGPFTISATVLLALVAFQTLPQSWPRRHDRFSGRKNIVLCLDGTWNQPGTKDFGLEAETNVYKLFRMLKGTHPKGRKTRVRYHASQVREYLDDKSPKQVGLYYQGVGNSVENSKIGQVMGGAFGLGADAIVERAYLDIVREYRPGDRIFLFGFSRGAAIARMLGGAIGRRDIPRSLWTLRLFGQHWTVWRSKERIDEDAPTRVEVLGCWDTVGAFGISKDILGIPFQRINLLHDLEVSLCVKRAYHMVALDETRDAFEPTLMESDPTAPNRVVEVWFSGNHANVGGGYSTIGLSDVTLDFLLRHLSSGYAWKEGMEPGTDESWGPYLSAATRKVAGPSALGTVVLDPDPCGRLRFATGAAYTHRPRKLRVGAVIHDTVFERMRSALPVYAPQSLFDLNEALVAKQAEIETETSRLRETDSIDDDELQALRERSRKNLVLTRWTQHLASTLAEGSPPNAKLEPATELLNTGRGFHG